MSEIKLFPDEWNADRYHQNRAAYREIVLSMRINKVRPELHEASRAGWNSHRRSFQFRNPWLGLSVCSDSLWFAHFKIMDEGHLWCPHLHEDEERSDGPILSTELDASRIKLMTLEDKDDLATILHRVRERATVRAGSVWFACTDKELMSLGWTMVPHGWSADCLKTVRPGDIPVIRDGEVVAFRTG